MDPLDHLLALPDGHRCSVCDERVPVGRVKLLAWRDDLAFVQLDCAACLSTTLGFVLAGRSDEPAEPPRADPISSDDVLDMHQLLATWRGDLTGLLARDDRGRAEIEPVTGGTPEATGTPQFAGEEPAEATAAGTPEPGTIDGTRFAHASEAEMARILDFYAVRWEYEPTTFPILWNLDGEVVESFAPDFYLPELELFLEMTTLKQRLVRKKNRKLRRLRELYPGLRIKLFYARDFRAMMLKYGRLALAEALSGTPGQVVSERAAEKASAMALIAPIEPIEPIEPLIDVEPIAAVEPVAVVEPVAAVEPSANAVPTNAPSAVRSSTRTRGGRRRRRPRRLSATGAEQQQETGA